MNEINLTGFLVINKPVGCSSYDCIRKIKRLLPKKTKIGHTGTLDEFASGILIICIGRGATKYSGTLMGLSKEYLVKAKLGELTDTLDRTGEIVEINDHVDVTYEDLKDAVKQLGTSYMQIPPVYSALKHKGKPLYHLARTGKLEQEELEKIIEGKKRTVHLYELDITDLVLPFFSFRAKVSKGTYIRSLANDIAAKLGLYATTHELTRSQVGACSLEKAIDLNEIESMEDIEKKLLSLDEVKGIIED